MSIEYEINLFDIALELGHTAIQPVLELHRPHKFLHIGITVAEILFLIKLLESPIPTATAPTPSQKAHFDNISGTKRGSIDPLVSKRPEKNSE